MMTMKNGIAVGALLAMMCGCAGAGRAPVAPTISSANGASGLEERALLGEQVMGSGAAERSLLQAQLSAHRGQ